MAFNKGDRVTGLHYGSTWNGTVTADQVKDIVWLLRDGNRVESWHYAADIVLIADAPGASPSTIKQAETRLYLAILKHGAADCGLAIPLRGKINMEARAIMASKERWNDFWRRFFPKAPDNRGA